MVAATATTASIAKTDVGSGCKAGCVYSIEASRPASVNGTIATTYVKDSSVAVGDGGGQSLARSKHIDWFSNVRDIRIGSSEPMFELIDTDQVVRSLFEQNVIEVSRMTAYFEDSRQRDWQ